MHLGAHHAVAAVGRGLDRARHRVVEARPAGAALELELRLEQRLVAAGAGEACRRAFRAAARSFPAARCRGRASPRYCSGVSSFRHSASVWLTLYILASMADSSRICVAGAVRSSPSSGAATTAANIGAGGSRRLPKCRIEVHFPVRNGQGVNRHRAGGRNVSGLQCLATLQPGKTTRRAVEGLGDGGRSFSRFTGAWVVCINPANTIEDGVPMRQEKTLHSKVIVGSSDAARAAHRHFPEGHETSMEIISPKPLPAKAFTDPGGGLRLRRRDLQPQHRLHPRASARPHQGQGAAGQGQGLLPPGAGHLAESTARPTPPCPMAISTRPASTAPRSPRPRCSATTCSTISPSSSKNHGGSDRDRGIADPDPRAFRGASQTSGSTARPSTR